MKTTLIVLFSALLGLQVANAAEHQVKMLNYGKEGGMVFEPAVVHAAVGDTVTFVPENSSHFVQTYVVPEGAKAWKSELDKPFSVKLENEGVFLYYCPPHLMMSMIGLVQVGKPLNEAVLLEKAKKIKPKLVMKSERLDNYLAQIKQ